ncbi:MAG: hypothetical protein NTW12_13800 [Deltaproteobacteria bacterium]|nr:hypothetical protein [Deltaproteobacteria bacterium]
MSAIASNMFGFLHQEQISHQRPRQEPTGAIQVPGVQQSGLSADYELMRRIAAIESELKKLVGSLNVFILPINSLNSKKWKLRKPPLTVIVERRGEEEFIACLYDINLYGYGDSIPDALDELRYAIVSQYEFLSEKKKEIELGELPERQLGFLDEIVEQVSA